MNSLLIGWLLMHKANSWLSGSGGHLPLSIPSTQGMFAVGSQSKCYTVVTGVWIIVVAVWGANSMACLSIRKVAHGLSLLKRLNALFKANDLHSIRY